MEKNKLFCLVLFVLLSGLSSCTKNAQQLVGKWVITECHEEGDALFEMDEGDTWTFTDDGQIRLSFYGGSMLMSSEYTCDNDELVIRGGDFADFHVDYQHAWRPAELIYTLEINSISSQTLSVSGKAGLFVGGTIADCLWSVDVELQRK